MIYIYIYNHEIIATIKIVTVLPAKVSSDHSVIPLSCPTCFVSPRLV